MSDQPKPFTHTFRGPITAEVMGIIQIAYQRVNSATFYGHLPGTVRLIEYRGDAIPGTSTFNVELKFETPTMPQHGDEATDFNAMLSAISPDDPDEPTATIQA